MHDLLDSNGRILMHMVLVFFPSVTVPYIVRTILMFNWVIEKVNHQIKCLQSWIVVVKSKIQEALMLFWQSTIRPLLDPIIEKMNNLSEALKMYLTDDASLVVKNSKYFIEGGAAQQIQHQTSPGLSVILRLPTDFGFFGFIIGVVGSITYNRFGLKFPTWIVACICYLLFCLKSWLEKHWLDFEEDLPLPSTCTIGSACLIRSFPRSVILLALSCSARDDIRPQLLQRIISYITATLYGIWWAARLIRGAPTDDRLPPYTRFTRRTHYAYYRFMIFSLAFDFLYVLGISVATSVPWPSITLIMFGDMFIYARSYRGYI
ncbi:hypothetical protein SLEP1_g49140 [Rubroshorea leprosula]|uniref:Uncharacterized protein n=1 Tax=Rubroshorea leprosula TaxID=152421 RepID=A0AAV5LXW1_9ROSI|nr:hypothetical protein SLEP1_g49140 [Rubroshorea leprosula]